MEKTYERMSWWAVAEQVQEEIEINWEEESFICPMCDEPILADDWEHFWAEEDDDGTLHPMCPICGFFYED